MTTTTEQHTALFVTICTFTGAFNDPRYSETRNNAERLLKQLSLVAIFAITKGIQRKVDAASSLLTEVKYPSSVREIEGTRLVPLQDTPYDVFPHQFGARVLIEQDELNAIGRIRYGSIIIEDGEIKISSKKLLVLLAVVGGVSAGVLNYKDTKENLAEIQMDISALLKGSKGHLHYEVEAFDCRPVDSDVVLNEIKHLLP